MSTDENLGNAEEGKKNENFQQGQDKNDQKETTEEQQGFTAENDEKSKDQEESTERVGESENDQSESEKEKTSSDSNNELDNSSSDESNSNEEECKDQENKEDLDSVSNVKKVRLEIDVIKKVSDHLQLPSQNLFYGKCWLGKLLSYIGAENPYAVEKDVKNPSQIPPTADVIEGKELSNVLYQFDNLNRLEAVKKLREEIGSIISVIESMNLDSREAAICRTESWKFLCQARFDLGNELSNIRENG